MRDGVAFATLQQPGTQPAPCEIGVDEERADLRGVDRRIERRGIAVGARITAEQRAAAAPT